MNNETKNKKQARRLRCGANFPELAAIDSRSVPSVKTAVLRRWGCERISGKVEKNHVVTHQHD
jgi:hypothetical protein